MIKTKKVILASIVILLTLLIASVASNAIQMGSANEEAKLRKEATNDSICLEIIPKKDEFEILEKSGNWYKVNYKKIKGYVESKYITIKEENNQNTVQTTNQIEENTIKNEINNTVETTTPVEDNEQTEIIIQVGNTVSINEECIIHIRPVINSISKGKISKGKKTQVVEKINGWIYINTEEISGWIREEKVTVEEIKEENTTVEETKKEENKEQLNKTGYIVSTGINFREESNVDSNILKVFVQNTQVIILEDAGDWYKIKYKEQEGYVLKTYVSEKKAEVTSRSAQTRIEQNSEEQEESSTTNTISKGQQVVEFAKKYLGYRYVYGGATPTRGFDCSGYTMYIYKQFGINLSHSATAQSKIGIKIDKSELQLGDMVFFSDYKTYKGIGHCGIYIGNNQFIHASTEKIGVTISSLNSGSYVKRYVTATRVI